MGALIPFVVIGIGLVAAVIAIAEGGKLSEAWKNAGDRLGLVYSKRGAKRRLEGTIQGARIELETFVRSSGKSSARFTRAEVRPARPIPARMELRRERGWTAVTKLVTGRDLEIGDAQFDREVLVKGDPVIITSLLDHRTRKRLVSFLRLSRSDRGRVESGMLKYERRGAPRKARDIEAAVRGFLDLGKRLTPRDTAPEDRLAAIAAEDPIPKVRFRTLKLLLEERPDHPRTAEAARRALEDPHRGIRLEAARGMGPEGRETLEQIWLDRESPREHRVAALNALLPLVENTQRRALLDSALASNDPEIQAAAVQDLAERPMAELSSRLVGLVPEASAPLAEALARALGRLSPDQAETPLLQLLEREEERVRIAAARALITAGTIRAVTPLMNAGRGLLTDLDLKRATREAVSTIQSRLEGVEGGRLSLAESEGDQGALSLAAEAGALSVTGAEGSREVPVEPMGTLREPDEPEIDQEGELESLSD